MAFKAGKYGSVKLGSATVVGMRQWELPGVSIDLLESTAFGDLAKEYIAGLKDYGDVNISGLYDPADTTGQAELITANYQGATVTNIRLYVDNTSYWTPNLTGDSDAGLLVRSFSIRMANNGLGEINFGGKCTGAWCLV